MAFDDTYRESIQTKHISNVGFTSTAKGVTNEAYALVNPHQVLASQIPAVDVVTTYGALTASGVAAGLVEEHIVKLTADPTVNNNKAWIATEDNCTTSGHSSRGSIRLNQWMRYPETQYKLRLYEDDGSGTAPNYSAEILPSEVAFNWEYDASAGIVYFDDDPSTNGKTIPLWGTLYTYVGDSVADSIGTTSSGIITVHNDLTGRTAASAHPASSIDATTSSFDGVLSSADDTVQKALDTLDDHNHDSRYYTESEIDTTLLGYSLTSHNHDGDYDPLGAASSAVATHESTWDHDSFTTASDLTTLSGVLQTEIDGKADLGHTHTESEITDLDKYTQAEVDALLATTSGSLSDDIVWEITDTPYQQIRPKAAYMGRAIYTTGDLTIGGDLTVSGTTTTIHSQELTVTDKIITVNAGEVGAGVTGSQYAGIEVDRGSEVDYLFVFDESQDNFRVGISGSLQAVATREDSPTDGYVATWNDSAKRFDTSIALVDLATDAELATVSGVLQTQITAIETDLTNNYYTSAQLDAGQLDNRYYTESEVDALISAISGSLGGDYYTKTELDGGQLDNRYYTESEVDSALSGKSDVGHTHDDRYYTETEIDAMFGGFTTTFLGLTDTISSYNAGRVLFTTASGVVDSSLFTYDTASDVLHTPGIQLSSGGYVDEIVTTVTSGTTDQQIPTAKAVWDLTEAAAGAVHTHYDEDCTYVDDYNWTYDGSFTSLPEALTVFVNGVKQRASDAEYYTAVINAGVLELTFGFTVRSSDWVNITWIA